MKRNTLEVGLHQWEPWHESIERSRRELGFDPAWPDEKVNQWAADNYGALIRPRAVAELAVLRLPPRFLEYWEDCFYNEYKDADGRPRGKAPTGIVPDHDLPRESSVVTDAPQNQQPLRKPDHLGRRIDRSPKLVRLSQCVSVVVPQSLETRHADCLVFLNE